VYRITRKAGAMNRTPGDGLKDTMRDLIVLLRHRAEG
jgi:hypothetical protein